MRTTKIYDDLYKNGGWVYNVEERRSLIRELIVKPSNWPPGGKVLEIGCGMGLYAHLLSEMGFQVTAVDLSQEGIRQAQNTYQGPEYIHADLTEFNPQCKFDGILSNGMSWFHYELDGVNACGVDVPRQTARLFEWLKPGGTFILKIKTDFSGTRPVDKVHNNRFTDYVNLFEPLGTVTSVTDARLGKHLGAERDAAPTLIRKLFKKTRYGVVITTQKS